MDKKQLVTIAITAVVSVIAREIFSSFMAWAKIKAQTETAKARARTIFNKNNRKIIWDAIWFSGSIWFFISVLHETSPIRRWDVVVLIISVINVIAWGLFLLRDAALAIVEHRDRQSFPPTQD